MFTTPFSGSPSGTNEKSGHELNIVRADWIFWSCDCVASSRFFILGAAMANIVSCMGCDSVLLGDLVRTCKITPARDTLLSKKRPVHFSADTKEGNRKDSRRSVGGQYDITTITLTNLQSNPAINDSCDNFPSCCARTDCLSSVGINK